MTERPIIFTTDMVRAILDGKKTQTRRVIKPQPVEEGWAGLVRTYKVGNHHGLFRLEEIAEVCPYGQVGDREWQKGMPPKDDYYYVEDFAEDKPVYLRRFLQKDYPSEGIEEGLLWAENEHGDPEAIELENLSLETIKWKRVGDRLWVREAFAKRTDGIVQIMYREQYYNLIKMLDLPDVGVKWTPSIHMFRKDSRIDLEITGVRAERVQEIGEIDAMKEGVSPHRELNTDGGRTLIDDCKDLWDSINVKRGYGWDTNPWCWVISFKRITDGIKKDIA